MQRINAEVQKASQSPDVLAKYQKMGVDPVKPHGPEVFETKIRSAVARWAKVQPLHFDQQAEVYSLATCFIACNTALVPGRTQAGQQRHRFR